MFLLHASSLSRDHQSTLFLLLPLLCQGVFEEMQAEDVVCVADEVQCGFGRTGDAFWGFASQGAVPDMVTIGKAMGKDE